MAGEAHGAGAEQGHLGHREARRPALAEAMAGDTGSRDQTAEAFLRKLDREVGMGRSGGRGGRARPYFSGQKCEQVPMQVESSYSGGA